MLRTQAVELRERLRELEVEAIDRQGPSATELQQSAVEGMEAAGVSRSDAFLALVWPSRPPRGCRSSSSE